MELNSLKPAPGAKKPRRRLGRGKSAGQGKTAGKGHKGQHARAGGYHKVGFEGGQMPLQRRLPKIGFTSMQARRNAEVRLRDLARVEGDSVDVDALKRAGLVPARAERVKVIATGTIERALTIKPGVAVTKGARAAIEAAGGKVESE